MYKIYSGLVGILIAVMVFFNGILANNLGNYLSTVIVHVVGLICVILVLVINKTKISLYKNIPIYLYSAGAIGVFTVLFNNIGFIRLGASITLALGLLGQSVSSIIIDHYGLLGMEIIKFDKKKLIGFALISLGIVIMIFY